MNLLTILVVTGIGLTTFVVSSVTAFKEFGKKKGKAEVQKVSKLPEKQHV